MKQLGLIVAIVTALVVIATWLVGLSRGFANGDEVFYGEFIRAMHRTGDWLTLRFQGVAILQRPALPISLAAAVSWFIPGELGMRLLPAVIGALVAVGSGALVWRETKDLFAAAATTAFVAAIPTMHFYGRLLSADPIFAAALLGALAATLRAQEDPRALLWVAVSAGLAVAIKSLAAAIPLAALLPWVLRALVKHGPRASRLLASAAVFLALALPYYVVSYLQHGDRFLAEHFGYNLVARAQGLEGIGLPGGFPAYARYVWSTDGAVATLLLVAGLAGCLFLAVRRREARLAVAPAAAILTFLGLSMLGTRLAHYLLPFYPAAAVAAGIVLARLPFRLSAFAAAAALVLLWRSSSAPAPSFEEEPAREAIFLGDAIGLQAPEVTRVYSLDWYAPAFGYYADRPWTYLSTSERMTRVIGSVDLFSATGAIRLCPPWPDEAFVIAGRVDRMLRARRLWPERFGGAKRLASAADYQLWTVPAN
jgi:4-amino-4-deoxy-L-arabinose transferase-like glycosyltransferase